MNKNYEVHCGNCNWWGMRDQMKAIYKPDYSSSENVMPEPACPICLSDQWLEYGDKGEREMKFTHNPVTSDEYWARQKLFLRDRERDIAYRKLCEAQDQLKEVIHWELLHCQKKSQ